MKARAYQALAEALYKGDGGPRYPEGIIESVRVALESAYEEGLKAGRADARTSVLREAVAIAQGAEQSARSRLAILERELEAHLNATRSNHAAR